MLNLGMSNEGQLLYTAVVAKLATIKVEVSFL